MDAAKRAQLKQYYNEHVATHSEREAEDKDAVNALNSDLSFGGRIYSDFKANDKWPNHDGFFEFVPEPDVSRIPEQIFDVQIKGTRNYRESGGVISYSLTSLAFPAFIGYKVTSNPGILFIVLFSPDRRSHRLFWKHVSPEFINDIDFSKESATIHLFPQDEIKTDYAGMEKLWSKLSEIADNHLFLNNLDSSKITEEEALDIINETCNDLSQIINEVKGNVKLRDSCSKKWLGIYIHCVMQP